ncbi:hypothetical protein [Actinomadura rubrisoli]|uniref:Uncharacterized protein n=1 Tax=Actinomadura rubrisoli TaxID=2530368 RepID=A0A4R5C212_9ACTN|nr:hypothetical protein [Actinomadura rubrisoli]TDD93641.1 hypothetical protein E1298_08900 [Actinomadura rubrisoli]
MENYCTGGAAYSRNHYSRVKYSLCSQVFRTGGNLFVRPVAAFEYYYFWIASWYSDDYMVRIEGVYAATAERTEERFFRKDTITGKDQVIGRAVPVKPGGGYTVSFGGMEKTGGYYSYTNRSWESVNVGIPRATIKRKAPQE